MAEWINVSERVPEIGADVFAWLVYTGPNSTGSVRADGHRAEAEHRPDGWHIWNDRDSCYWSVADGHGMYRVTHWMPQPEPPEEVNGNGKG